MVVPHEISPFLAALLTAKSRVVPVVNSELHKHTNRSFEFEFFFKERIKYYVYKPSGNGRPELCATSTICRMVVVVASSSLFN